MGMICQCLTIFNFWGISCQIIHWYFFPFVSFYNLKHLFLSCFDSFLEIEVKDLIQSETITKRPDLSKLICLAGET